MLHLVTGGSGSGKSWYAEQLAVNAHKEKSKGMLYYIATMYPFDEECHERIEKHQRMRAGKGFTTVECYTCLEKVKVTNQDVVLLECMSNLLANEMFQKEGRIHLRSSKWTDETERNVENKQLKMAILDPLSALADTASDLIVVTNEIFSDGEVYEAETRTYVRMLGKINCELAKKAALVTEVVCGIPVCGKSKSQVRKMDNR